LDFRIGRFQREFLGKPFKMARFPRPEDGLRAIADRAPQAEAFAVSWIERIRPTAARVYLLRRRIATIAVGVLAGGLFVHVMFGANGMVVYKQKRADYQGLRRQIDQVQQENDRYTQQIQGLKSDQKSIEKEAREQLGYAKPGEYVYVAPTPKSAPPANHSAKK
jgi:cell division protein FtsB